MEFVPYLVVIGFIISVVNMVKMAQAGQWNKVGTLLFAYATGIACAFILGNADVAAGIEALPGQTLGALDAWSLVIYGIFLAGSAATAYDALPINTPSFGEQDSLV